jgi:hypothetical protein
MKLRLVNEMDSDYPMHHTSNSTSTTPLSGIQPLPHPFAFAGEVGVTKVSRRSRLTAPPTSAAGHLGSGVPV